MPTLRLPTKLKKKPKNPDIITGTGSDKNTSLSSKHPHHIQPLSRPSYKLLVPIVVLVAGIGIYSLLFSRAAIACTTGYTLSPGANITSTIGSAPAGTVICLNAGNYGYVSIANISKSSDVTIQSTSGKTATIGFNMNNVNHLKLESLILAGAEMSYQTKNITITGSTITSQVMINMGSNGGNYGNANILIDNNTIEPISVCTQCYEGRIDVLSELPSGVTISNNYFKGPGESDGIQLGADGVIIRGNTFDGIIQGSYGRHVDAVQLYGASNTTIDGNYFINGGSYIMAPDGGYHEIITNNVFKEGDYNPAVQMGSHDTTTFSHNTVIGISAHMTRKYESDPNKPQPPNSKDGIIKDNIFTAGGGLNFIVGDGPLPRPNGCTNCTVDHNFGVGGTNPITDTIKFVSTSPAKFEDYALASDSAGKGAASDSKDIGVDASIQAQCIDATPSNFASQVSSAQPGQKICLATGNYGTWTGINKAIIIRAMIGANPQMLFNFGNGASGFTLDGIKNAGGNVTNGASNITIKNSDFTSALDIDGSTIRGMVIDSNTFNWQVGPTFGGGNAKIFVGVGGTSPGAGAIITNNTFSNGDLDGIHVGGGSGLLITNNTFDNLCDFNLTQNGQDSNHTDQIQFEGGSQTRIADNYIHASSSCPTQGITSFDSGTNGVIIENNVVDIHRPWGIEWYSDQNSVIRHNTVVWYPDSDCDFTGQPCGQIDINRKTADPAGSGTQVFDNITTSVGFNSGSTGTSGNNLSGQNVTYASTIAPLNHDSFILKAPTSALTGASDGKAIGVYKIGSATTPPTPTDTTPPTVSLTAPASGASVSGTSVSVSATAIDTAPTGVTASGVAGVQFKLDGNNIGSEDTTSPYSITWNASQASNGTHTITAVARDGAGNTTTSTARTVTVTGGTNVLLGSNAVASGTDSNSAGDAEAFRYTATGSGTTANINFYVGSGSSATSIKLGVYTNNNNHPGTLLTSTTISSLQSNTWNSASLSPTVNLTSGNIYWIVLLPVGGSLTYNDQSTGSCSEGYSSASISTLPATWSSGQSYGTCNLSAYVTGGFISPPTIKPGDVNGDGSVNISDISQLLTAYGQTGSNLAADLDKNSSVNIADLSIILTNYGK